MSKEDEEREIREWIRKRLEKENNKIVGTVNEKTNTNEKNIVQKKTGNNKKLKLLLIVLVVFFLLVDISLFLVLYFVRSANRELIREGWRFIEFKMLNDTTFKVYMAEPSKNYVFQTKEYGKLFLIYPEVRREKNALTGYTWATEILQNVSENATIEIKLPKNLTTSLPALGFILKKENEEYSSDRFSFITNISDCREEGRYLICNQIENFSDICLFLKRYKQQLKCPFSGVHKFYFYLLANDTIIYVKQIKFSDRILLDL